MKRVANRTLITFASWEERFVLGLIANLDKFDVDEVWVFYFDEYKEMTAENRGKASKVAGSKLHLEMLSAVDAVSTWAAVVSRVGDLTSTRERLLIDYSTMPREIMWYVLWAAEQRGADVECLYHSPKEYGIEWLSRDPRAPRMAFKLSGIADPSRRTALLITAGYDIQRVRRLVNWCEPERLMVGVQEGGRFSRNEDAMRIAEAELTKHAGCSTFKLDAFGESFGEVEIVNELRKVIDSHNVILASMGPKLSALSLYRIQRTHENVGLVYAPAGQYNEKYSRGIGQLYSRRMGTEGN